MFVFIILFILYKTASQPASHLTLQRHASSSRRGVGRTKPPYSGRVAKKPPYRRARRTKPPYSGRLAQKPKTPLTAGA